jgi:hypothetical protein
MSHPLVMMECMTSASTFSCRDCVMQHTDHCNDCLVTFICEREPDDAVVINADEARAVRMLARAGLVPDMKHVDRAG